MVCQVDTSWDQLLIHLTQFLEHQSYEVIVHTSTYDGDPLVTTYNGAHVDFIDIKANSTSSIL